jgi:PAS domain-containing protein
VAHIEPQPFDSSKAARLQDLADFVADEWARAKAAKAQREAERALSTVQSMFSALAETMPISLVMTDMALRVIAASRIWREEFGLNDTPVVGRTLFDISPVYGPFEAPLQQALSGQVVVNVQIRDPEAGRHARVGAGADHSLAHRRRRARRPLDHHQ